MNHSIVSVQLKGNKKIYFIVFIHLQIQKDEVE